MSKNIYIITRSIIGSIIFLLLKLIENCFFNNNKNILNDYDNTYNIMKDSNYVYIIIFLILYFYNNKL
jgi:hypothetical protein